jgi:hypothetical protein
MNVGDIVKLRHITDFEGIILSLAEWIHDEYGESEIKIWKVFWYKHPYGENPPYIDKHGEQVLRHA